MSDDEGAAPAECKEVVINERTYKPLADGYYDVIVLGTGLKECVLSGLLAMRGMKVLHIDRNNYYGSETASLNLTNLYRKFIDASVEDAPESFMALGQNRDYNVDLIPKFIMADGKLVKMLVKADVADYLEFKQVDGSFVYKDGGGVHKMPATESEALTTSLMGFFQKRKFRNFLNYIMSYKQEDSKTWDGLNLKTSPMRALYAKFDLDENTQDFTGHAMALWPDDSYLDRPALESVESLKLYAYSLERHGKSPFIYPKYGIGGLPEAFSRKAAVNGGTYILNQGCDEILFDTEGKAAGIRAGEQAAAAKILIGEPQYFPASKVRSTGKVVRSICLMNHPIAALAGAKSGQIIIPQRQAHRHNDIYISILSSDHKVVAAGYYLAICSTTVETANPVSELATAFALLEPIHKRFDNIVESFEPIADGTTDKCFISSSYDASSHFESTCSDLLAIYQRVTGEDYLTAPAPSADDKK